ncbi:MAG: hypothetical protein ACE5HE_14670, partial [Phycisphaerae bacterium]
MNVTFTYLLVLIAVPAAPDPSAFGACGSGAGDCCSANGTPGCNDLGTECCAIVCACDPFCCETAWDEDCATFGVHNSGCGAQLLCAECADADGDGVPDALDACCATPAGLTVDADGRPVGDLDSDCDVDLDDFALFQANLTGVMEEPDGHCPQSCIGINCNDGDSCTIDTCVLSSCIHAQLPCPDNRFCRDGECVQCVTDTDCDDGLYCTGTETCDTSGSCVSAGDPCISLTCNCRGVDQDAICDEGDTAAQCSCPDCPAILFTLNQDTLIGSTGDDPFVAPLEFNPGSGTQMATLQTGDSANGLAGNDTLDATFNFPGVVAPAALIDINTINITNFAGGTVTVNGNNIVGVDVINQVNSVGDLAVTNLQELTDIGFTGIADPNVDLTVSFAQASTTGGMNDRITCILEEAEVGIASIVTAGFNGFETVDFASIGSTPNRLTALTQTTGMTMATATFTGSADLQVDTLPNTILIYNASGMTGDLQLGSGTDNTTYAQFATANLIQMTLGDGDDLVIFEDTFTANDFLSSTLDCRGGTDVVQNSFAASFGVASPLRNCEEVRFNASANGVSVNFSGHTGLT